MATSLRILTSLAIAVAAIQVAFATYTYYPPCDPPRSPQYGGYGPEKKSYAIGSKIKYHCNDGYKLSGASWTVCKFNKKSYWTYPAPVCKPIRCHDLDDITYGGVKVASYYHGSTATYYCNKGYKLYGDASRTCHKGYWGGKAPVCKPIICLKPDDIPYGSIKMTGNTPGSRIQYSCNKGYKLYGDEYRQCLYTGYWGGKAPVCKPIVCHDLDDIKYGGVKVTNKHHGSRAQYYCNKGYKLYGDEYRQCLYTGYWGGKAPVCKPIVCHDLDDIKYGGVKLTSKHYGSRAQYYCNKGYKLYGDEYRDCLYTGYWGGKAPVCKPIICHDLDDIKYGGVKLTSKHYGSRAQYYCNKGYKLYGDEYRNCLYTGYWGGKAPVCKPIICHDLDDIKYGGVKLSSKHYGSRAQYYCNKGYKLYGDEYRNCLYTGYWGGKAPVCKPIVCHDLDDIKYGGVKLAKKHYGSRAQYYCNKGYKLYGDEYRDCLYTGYWGGKAPVCKPIICHDLDDIKYGGVKLASKHYGSRAQYYCNKGYKLVGDEYRDCLYTGYWGGKAPVCKPIRCNDLDNIEYGGVKLSSYHPGSRAWYYCNKGYKLYGDAHRQCLYNGKWDGKAPVCKPIPCPHLDNIKYGGVKLTAYHPGSRAQYYCEKGYKLYGDEYRQCLHGGYWGGKIPVCKPIICHKLAAIPYGGVKVPSYKHGSRAQYFCNKGYKLYGDEYVECLHTGYWGGKTPVCKPIKCSDLDDITYGGVKVTHTSPGSTAYYYCNKHHKLVGNRWRKCQYDGYWSGEEPVCKKILCSKLDHPQYGKVKVDTYYPTSKAHYSCDDGYYLLGLSWRKCLNDGTWYGKPPVCHKKTVCPHPPAPQYGQVSITGYTPNSKVYYSCDHGYKLKGLQWRKCLRDGTWYGKAPVCHPVKY